MKADTFRNWSILVETSYFQQLEGLRGHVWPSQVPEEWPGEEPWYVWTVHGQGPRSRKVLSLLPAVLKVVSAKRALTSGNGKAKS